jgi:hypothetical protein
MLSDITFGDWEMLQAFVELFVFTLVFRFL